MAARCAWVVVGNADERLQLCAALRDAGWNVSRTLGSIREATSALGTGATGLPDLIVCGLRFNDGDGFQLIRSLRDLPQAPALYFASRQQRAVIRAAITMAHACGLHVAGFNEQPADSVQIAGALRGFARPVPRMPLQAPALMERPQLEDLLDRQAVEAWLQPKVNVARGEVIGFETLMRARDSDGAMILPDCLVPSLSACGLLERATFQIAQQTAEFIAECLAQGRPVSGAINVSLQSLDTAFFEELVRLVEVFRLDPGWITLEVTETDAMGDVPRVIESTARLRMFGFNLAIDDFGTAYSSLFQLSQIPFSELKIERAFVSGLEHDPAKRAIIEACVKLASSLGLHVVAEGVETLAAWDFLKRAGCSQAQGYLIAPPMPIAQARAWISSLMDMRWQ